MIVLFFGPPGSGKGTQAALFAERFGFAQVSTGNLLRALHREENPDEETRAAFETMARGELVPDEFVYKITLRALDPLLEEDRSVVLDGVVRRAAQARFFGDYFEKRGVADKVRAVWIELPEREAVRRLTERAVKEWRADDAHEIMLARFEHMGAISLDPVLAYYRERGILQTVNGSGTVEEVFERIRHALNL